MRDTAISWHQDVCAGSPLKSRQASTMPKTRPKPKKRPIRSLPKTSSSQEPIHISPQNGMNSCHSQPVSFILTILHPAPSNNRKAWKVRFDGFGKSDYGGDNFSDLHKVFDTSTIEQPPWYQPQGPSHTGGSFAIPICVCSVQGQECKCKDEQAKKARETAAAGAKANADQDQDPNKSEWIEVKATHAGPVTAAEGKPLQFTGMNGCSISQTFRTP